MMLDGTQVANPQFGKFTLSTYLNSGGMGEVFEASVVGPDGPRTVALKRFVSHFCQDPAAADRFVERAKLLLQLKHPNIRDIYSFGRIKSSFFLAMEYIRGQSLHQIIQTYAAGRQTIPVPIALHIGKTLCDALGYAHGFCDRDGTPQPVVHGNLTPSNVLFDRTATVKLINFGFGLEGQQLTSAGIESDWVGDTTEQPRPDPLDHRVDVLGVGLILYELLTGQPAYPRANHLSLAELPNLPTIAPPSSINPAIDEELDAVVQCALQPQPRDRFADMADMATAISGYEERANQQCTRPMLSAMVDKLFGGGTTGETATASVPLPVPLDVPASGAAATEAPTTIEKPAASAAEEEPTQMAAVELRPGKRKSRAWVAVLGGVVLLGIGVMVGFIARMPPANTATKQVEPLELVEPKKNRVSPTASLRITSKPSGAAVTLFHNNRELELSKSTTPTAYPGLTDNHQYRVRVAKAGYVTVERNLHWRFGDPVDMSFVLDPLPEPAPPEPEAEPAYEEPEEYETAPARLGKKRNRRLAQKRRKKARASLRREPARDPAPEPEVVLASHDRALPAEPVPEPPAEPAPIPVPTKVEKPAPPPPQPPPAPEAPKEPPKPPPPTTGKLVVASRIEGYVFINGRNTGKITPSTFTLSPGNYEVVVVLRQTNTRIKHQVAVKAGKSVRLNFKGVK